MTASSNSEHCHDGVTSEEPQPNAWGAPLFGSREPQRYFVVIGNDVARRVCGFLRTAGHLVCYLAHPTDTDLRQALDREVAGVAVLRDKDVESCAMPSRSSTSARASRWW